MHPWCLELGQLYFVTPTSCHPSFLRPNALGGAAKLPLPLLPLHHKPEKPPNALGGCSETFISFPQAALNSWTPPPKSRSD